MTLNQTTTESFLQCREYVAPPWLWLLFGILAACAIAQVFTEFKEYLK